MQRQQCETSNNMKNQENMTSPKDHNNLPITDPKDMEICSYVLNKEIDWFIDV